MGAMDSKLAKSFKREGADPPRLLSLAQRLRLSLAAKGHPVTVQQIIRLLEERARREAAK